MPCLIALGYRSSIEETVQRSFLLNYDREKTFIFLASKYGFLVSADNHWNMQFGWGLFMGRYYMPLKKNALKKEFGGFYCWLCISITGPYLFSAIVQALAITGRSTMKCTDFSVEDAFLWSFWVTLAFFQCCVLHAFNIFARNYG